MKNNQITVTNNRGVKFIARIIQNGDAHGLDDRLVYDDPEPVVAYYLPKYISEKSPRGYFIGSWHVSTVLDHPDKTGHLLDGGDTDFVLEAKNVKEVQQFIRNTLPEYEGWGL